MISFSCPECRFTIRCAEDRSGTVLPCPRCRHRCNVPPPAQRKTTAGTSNRTLRSGGDTAVLAPPSSLKGADQAAGAGTRSKWFVGTVAVLCTGAVLFLIGQPVQPTPLPPPSSSPSSGANQLSVAEAIQIGARGDGQFLKVFRFPSDDYADFKRQNPDPAQLRLKFPFRPGQIIGDFQARYDDAAGTVTVSWISGGMASPSSAPTWEALLPEAAGLALVSIANSEAVLRGAVQTELGPADVELTVRVPPGSSNVRLLSMPARLAYVPPPPTASPDGSHPFLQVNVEVKPMMWCLLPVYGKPPLRGWWLARAVLKNGGDQTLRDIRVRFRAPDCDSNWTEFTRPALAPGQAALAHFSPTLDVPKLAQVNGLSAVRVEVEYQYQQSDGRVVSRKGQKQSASVFPPNQLVISRTAYGSFAADNSPAELPLALAALVTPADSVIQAVAARIKARAGQEPPAASDDQAQRFLKELYDFMRAHLQCQNPLGPGGNLISPLYDQERMPLRAVQCGRELLRRKTGSPLDLALLFASVCEAAGLEPVLVCSLDYCFPAVKLPGGSLRPVEVGLIRQAGYEDACKAGEQEFQAARKDPQLLQVDPVAQHRAGIESPPLKPISLKEINFPDPDAPVAARPYAPPQLVGRPGTPAPLTGKWFYSGRTPDRSNLEWTLVLAKDDTYQSKLRKTVMGVGGLPRVEKVEHSGTFKTTAKTIVFTNQAAEEEYCEYMQDRDNLYITPLAGGNRMQMRFVRLPD
jgi:hypothetical protein